MPRTTTIGRVLVNEALPESLRDPNRELDKKKVKELFRELAEKYPDQYVEALQTLSDVSRMAATEYGGVASVRLSDLKLPPRVKAYRKELAQRVEKIAQDPQLTSAQKNDQIIKMVRKAIPVVQKKLEQEAANSGNMFALSIAKGFRGNPTQLTQMLFGNMLVADHRGRPIPVPGLHGYAEGVSDVEYWADSYGNRKAFCLHPDTLVRMGDFSIKKLCDITPGDYVLGADADGRTASTKVVNVYHNGEREMFRYTFRPGRYRNCDVSLVATEEHQVLAKIKDGDRFPELRNPSKLPLSHARRTFGLVPAAGDLNETSVERPLSYVIGYLLGNGHFSKEASILLASADERLLQTVSEMLNPCGLYLKKKKHNPKSASIQSYGYLVLDKECSREDIRATNRMKTEIRRLGLEGVRSFDKFIPEEVFQWSTVDVAMFISGYFEADGSIVPQSRVSGLPALRFHSTSEKLLQQLKVLLAVRLGVYSSGLSRRRLEDIPESNSQGHRIIARHDCFAIRVTNRTSLERLMPVLFEGGCKAAEAHRMWVASESSKRDDSLVFHFKEKEYLGISQAFDLEVANKDHLFVLANGMIVSNSDVQFATAKTGFLAKQLSQMAQRLKITTKDCGTKGGFLVDGDDPEIIGSVVNRDVGDLRKGDVITKKNLSSLVGKKPLVRSVAACQAQDGICQKCAGKREGGEYPTIGSYIGITSARIISEPMTQGMALSAKHLGGQVGVNDENLSGFEEINQFVQVPKVFKGGAVLAPRDGKVTLVTKAPQGGHYIKINDMQVHVPVSREVTVKKGDEVEAGDILSDGTPNPGDIAYYKGLGEGRMYFADKFRELLANNGVPAHRRNVETLARAFFDKIKIIKPEGLGEWSPGEVISYADFQNGYEPRKGNELRSAKRSMGWYLEEPILHYTIGTRITPKVAKFLDQEKLSQVRVHPDPPGFEPYVVRAMDAVASDPDWKTRMGAFNLKKGFLDAATKGSRSSHKGTSPVPSLMDPTKL